MQPQKSKQHASLYRFVPSGVGERAEVGDKGESFSRFGDPSSLWHLIGSEIRVQ